MVHEVSCHVKVNVFSSLFTPHFTSSLNSIIPVNLNLLKLVLHLKLTNLNQLHLNYHNILSNLFLVLPPQILLSLVSSLMKYHLIHLISANYFININIEEEKTVTTQGESDKTTNVLD